MFRLLAALLAPLVVIAGLILGLPTHQGPHLQTVDAVRPEPAALGSALERAALERAGEQRAGEQRETPSRKTTRAGQTAVATADEEPAALPLRVTMDGLSTAVVPKHGPVVVRGRVFNDSYDTWTDINVYACSSGTPITTPHDLRHAAEATTDDVVCGRTSVFTTIEELTPGASATYRLTIPRDELGIGDQRGAYWFGVQTLGSSTEGRDAVADGTIRTFLPQVGAGAERPTGRASFTVALPIRARTLHTAEGKLAAEAGWRRSLAPGGRLANLLTLAEDAPAGGAALLVDPAVVSAVQQMAAGNPARSLGTPVAKEGEEGEEQPTPADDEAETEEDADEAAPQPDADAVAWLERFTTLARRLPVLALPYGDLDVAGAARHDSKALTRARQESDAVFAALGIATTPVIAPPNGLLSAETREIAGGATLIASSLALPEELAEGSTIPSAVTIGSQSVLVSEAGLAQGGPAPTSGTEALALRQRLLAEGLVRADESSSTLVVLPWETDPGPSARHFFDQLDRPFVRTTGTLPSVADAVELPDLVYPTSQLERETSGSRFSSADQLTELGDTLDRLLAEDDGVGRTATREALSATSYLTRDGVLTAAGLTGAAAASISGARDWFTDNLARVDVAVPNFVILGSTEGPFAMTVTNGLKRPIRLGVRATTSGELDIRAPRTINVPASASRTVNLVAHTTQPGVHSLVLVVTDADGRPVRKSQDISIRSRDVGWVIWLIMGTGAALLFAAIAMRWRRRLRAARQSPVPPTAPVPPTTSAVSTEPDGVTDAPEAP